MDWIQQELKGKKILIVDDNQEFADILKEQLESVGINVVGVVGKAKEAVKMTEKLDPSLVIMDIKLPDMDGIEAAKKINEQEPRPILLLSGYSDGDMINRAKEAGIITYLVKPVTVKELLPSIVLTMGRFREMVTLKATVDDMKETLANRKIIEQAKGLLMEKKGLTEREAFNTLRKKSQEQNKPMAEIARTLVMMQDLL
jgi:two-component system, response regulator PdtaR